MLTCSHVYLPTCSESSIEVNAQLNLLIANSPSSCTCIPEKLLLFEMKSSKKKNRNEDSSDEEYVVSEFSYISTSSSNDHGNATVSQYW